MMTHRERMLATVRGEPTDCLPCVPRLDLWYNARKKTGTLPDKYRNATLKQIIEDLDVGFHTAIPDFQACDDPMDAVDRALGIWGAKSIPWRAELRNVQRIVSYTDDTRRVEYRTPYGNLTTAVIYNEFMRTSGITITHVAEHAIKSAADFEAVGYIFENIEVCPRYDYLAEFKEYVGDLGIICSRSLPGASPMHEIVHELIDYETFCYERHDHPDELRRLAERMMPYYDKVLDAAIHSPGDWVFLGSNFDVQITWPGFVAEWATPFLARAADKVHAAGKYLLSHTDGENKGLLPLFVEGKIDIADSICPSPLTSLTLRQVREAFAGRITIWGGIPSVSVLEDSMSDHNFEKLLDDLFLQMGKGDHLIVSIADTAPPEMKFSRLEKIIKMCKEFGPVTP
jgi:hypothetical protein